MAGEQKPDNDIKMDVPYLLAGDIGGTRSRLALFAAEGDLAAPLARAEYASAAFPDLETLAGAFLAGVDVPVRSACFGVAGPVRAGRARLTHLPWTVEEERLRACLGLQTVRVINDVQALAAAVPFLAGEDYATLQEGRPEASGTIAVAAVGTGLGVSFLAWDGERHRAHPTEAGHAAFAPADARQERLLPYLRGRFGQASREQVCSGTGIGILYDHLKREAGTAEESGALEQIAAASDPVPRIVACALEGGRPGGLCRRTMELFVSILGAVCGSLALDFLATGGIFLGGGIPGRILPLLRRDAFLEAFRGRGAMSGLLAEIPLRVILNPAAALTGAAREARGALRAGAAPTPGGRIQDGKS